MEKWLPNNCQLSPLTESIKRQLKTGCRQKKAQFIRCETHDHVLQSTLGQPAVEEHGDEDVPYGGPEYLWNVRRLAAGIDMHFSC